MALVNSTAKINNKKKCLTVCKKFYIVNLDHTKTSNKDKLTALIRDIDKISKKLKPWGLISTSRTGAVAMTRGAKIFN